MAVFLALRNSNVLHGEHLAPHGVMKKEILMKKLAIILLMIISVGFCVSANEIKWFDIEPGYSVYYCDSENIILEKTKPELNSRFALCSQKGVLLSEFEYFSLNPVSESLYNGTVIENDVVTTSVINFSGEEILRNESHSADTLVFYLHPDIADEEIRVADSEKYDEFYIFGKFVVYKKDECWALGDNQGNFITDYIFEFFTVSETELPGKIMLSGNSCAMVIDVISGKRIEGIISVVNVANNYIAILKNGNNKLSFANTGAPVLHNYTYIKTIHSNANRNVSIENQFLTDAEIHGKTLRVSGNGVFDFRSRSILDKCE